MTGGTHLHIVIPLVLMPVMMLGLPQLLGGLFEREAVNVTPVAVEGLDNLPDSLQGLLELSLIELQETADAEAAVRDGDFDVGLAVPDGFEDALADNGAPSLTVQPDGQHAERTGERQGEHCARPVPGAAGQKQPE